MNMNCVELREMPKDGLEFVWKGISLFQYVPRSEAPPDECTKPYFHPLRNLHGDVITNYRPNDHRWHHGLSMTMTLVNHTNFWGGPTYRKEDRYQRRNNIGSQVHLKWIEKKSDEKSIHLVEEIAWNNENDEPCLVERRVIDAEVFPESSCWRLKISCHFENVSATTLKLGTYESEEGLAGSHYTGLFLRLSRDFLGLGEKNSFGSYLSDGQRGAGAVHGASSPWMACVGSSDNSSAFTTVILCDHESNPNYPLCWFYRPDQPSIGMPFVASKAIVMEPHDKLCLRHTLLVVDGVLEVDDAKAMAAVHAPS